MESGRLQHIGNIFTSFNEAVFFFFFFHQSRFCLFWIARVFFFDVESNFAFFFSVCRGEILKSKCKFEYRIASLLELDMGAFYMATVIQW